MATHLDARTAWQIFETLGLAGCYEFSYDLKRIHNPTESVQWDRDQLADYLRQQEIELEREK